MKGVIKLKRPVKIDGAEVSELSYDTDKITMDHYCRAANRSIVKGGGPTGANVAVDAGMQIYLGMYACIAENPGYDVADMERVTGHDLIEFMKVGLSFINGRDESAQEGSGASSGDMREPTTPTPFA